jgi:hypothetical protein
VAIPVSVVDTELSGVQIMSSKSVASRLASCIQARLNCIQSGNGTWRDRWESLIGRISDDYLPSGSGIDHGTSVDLGRSTGSELVLLADYHHMDEGGCYDGWTEHEVLASPTFDGFSVDVSGPNRNDIREYLGDVFHSALAETITDDAWAKLHADVAVV